MKNLWQSVCKKIKERNLISKDAALRELKEEIELVAICEDL